MAREPIMSNSDGGNGGDAKRGCLGCLGLIAVLLGVVVFAGLCSERRDQARAAAEREAATAREDSLRQAREDSVRAYQALSPDERARVDSLAQAAAVRADSLRQVAAARRDSVRQVGAARQDSVRRARETALADSLQGWIRGGGGVNPLGQAEPILYLRSGNAAERIPFPYQDAGAFLRVRCLESGGAPSTVDLVMVNGPPLQGGFLGDRNGEVRIDLGPIRPVLWMRVDASALTILYERDGAEDIPLNELRAGAELVTSVPTTAGTLYWRFSLYGFATVGRRCR